MPTARPDGPLSTAEQIDAYLKSSPVLETDQPDAMDGVVPGARNDGKVHGEVAVGVGTGGYRSLYARADMPLGDTGRLSLSIEDSKFGRDHGYYGRRGGQSFGAGLAFGYDRQRCGLQAMTPPRPLDAMRGTAGDCAAAAAP